MNEPTAPALDRVVVGVDFAEPSGDAAAWAARHLAPLAELVLVHAVYVPEPPPSLEHLYSPIERLVDVARVGAEQQLRDLSRSLGAPLVWPEIRVGRPDEVIVAVAAEYTAGLIVVGPHADRRGGRSRLGSTAERILWRATSPVLVAQGTGDGPPLRLLAAVDGSEITRHVLAWVDFLMASHGSSAVLAHVVDWIPTAGAIAFGNLELVQGGDSTLGEPPLRDAMRWLQEQKRALARPERAEVTVLVGRPAQAILTEAERRESDLIVAGNRGAGGVERFLLGSVAAAVLREATCSVLVVPDEARVPRA